MKSFDKNRLFLWHYIFAILFTFIAVKIKESIGYTSPYTPNKPFMMYCSAIIIAPIIETIICQLIPFKILRALRINNYYIALILLTMLFSALHQRFFDNLILFAFFTFTCGIMVNYFLQIIKRENTKKAVCKMMIYHSVYNTTILIISYIDRNM